MATWTSWKTPGTVSSQTRTGGSVSWTNPSNASSSDNTYATAFLAGNSTHWLWCTNFGFTSSDIPEGSTITGIKVRFERKQSDAFEGGISTAYFKIIIAGSESGSQKTQSVGWPITDGTSSDVGGSGDVWSTSITQVNCVATDTGVAIAALDSAGMGTTASVDVVEIAFEYEAAASERRRLFAALMG